MFWGVSLWESPPSPTYDPNVCHAREENSPLLFSPLATYEIIMKTKRRKKETLLERVNPGVAEGGGNLGCLPRPQRSKKNAAWVA